MLKRNASWVRWTRFALLLLLGLVVNSAPGTAADKTWIEVRSPHFRVVSDGTEKDAREVARAFEQIRAVFAKVLPGIRLETGTPFLIVAPNDEQSSRNLMPQIWKQKGFKPAGFYHDGWEKEFAMVRLDVMRRESNSQTASSAFEVVYHEYTHSIMNANFRWLPTWLNEGFAEFYGNTRFEQSKLYVGAPSQRASSVGNRPIFDLEKLIGITSASKEYRDELDAQMFYYESWGLVHYLMLAPEMDQGRKLVQFVGLLEKGVDQKKAFNDAIGNLKTVESQLDLYLARRMLNSYVLPNPPDIRPETFVVRKLTPAEFSSELGAFQFWIREGAAARTNVELALKADAQSGPAHELMGFLHFAEGKDAEALKEFERAIQLDDHLYLSKFYKVMMSPIARSDREEDRMALRSALEQVVIASPAFPAARIQMARLSIREGNLTAALNYALQAQRLAPGHAGYNTLIGNIFYGLGRNEEAADLAKYVADRWEGGDREEAIELWQKLPPGTSQREGMVAEAPPAGAKTISGKVGSVTCSQADSTLKIAIDGQSLVLSRKDYSGSFSDTIWYGGDHFSFCYHLEGLRAVVWYKPSSGANSPAALLRLDIRDDIDVKPSR